MSNRSSTIISTSTTKLNKIKVAFNTYSRYYRIRAKADDEEELGESYSNFRILKLKWTLAYAHLYVRCESTPDQFDLAQMSTSEAPFETFNPHRLSDANPAISIHKVVFEGLERTDRQFLSQALTPELKHATNLVELSEALNSTFKRLEGLNIFKEVSVLIDKADDSSISNPDTNPVKLVFQCKEKRFNIRTGTELQRRDIAWVIHWSRK